MFREMVALAAAVARVTAVLTAVEAGEVARGVVRNCILAASRSGP